jgi:hypothetical protein
MKIQDITPKQLQAIEQAMQTAVSRLGIHVTFKASVQKAYNNDQYISIESTEFQTYPVMFKSIKVTGECCTKAIPDGLQIYFIVNYTFDHFGGGHNGSEIGRAQFEIYDDGSARFFGLTLNQ